MPQSITRGVTPFSVGTTEYIIDGLPPNSEGYELILGRRPQWDSMTGRIFLLTVEIALDGVTYQLWQSLSLHGGPPPPNPDGATLTTWASAATWPGENDGAGGRRKLRAVNLRVTMQVEQSFTADSVVLRTV